METKTTEEPTNTVTTLTPTNTTPIQTPVNQYNTVSSYSHSSSSMLSIKVRLVDLNIVKTLQFNPATLVFDALKIIREKIPEINTCANGIKISKERKKI